MCWPSPSLEASPSPPCPMCKVYPPRSANQRCPHAKDICSSALHPKHDVLYLTTAEVPLFNGCGFCKFARANPSFPPLQNPGSPGCCRAPTPSEEKHIPALSWAAVSVVHSVPIPVEIKNLLARGGMTSPSFGARATAGNKGSPTSPRTKALPTTPKSRPSDTLPSSLPASSPLEGFESLRRRNDVDRRASSRSPPSKNLDLEGGTPRRSRPPLSTIASAMSGIALSPPQSSRPRASSVSNTTPKNSPARPTGPATVSRATALKRPTLAAIDPANIPAPPSINSACSSGSSSSGGSSGSGSTTDGTLTSDGGFTDYLSDESEAELQRQAEAKAVIVAQNRAEEQEFKAARNRLANVDLRPPRSWNPSAIPNEQVRAVQMDQIGGVYGATPPHYGGFVQVQAGGR